MKKNKKIDFTLISRIIAVLIKVAEFIRNMI